MAKDESGRDEHEKELDHEERQEENQRITVGGKHEHSSKFELEHKGPHWPHSHSKGPNHK